MESELVSTTGAVYFVFPRFQAYMIMKLTTPKQASKIILDFNPKVMPKNRELVYNTLVPHFGLVLGIRILEKFLFQADTQILQFTAEFKECCFQCRWRKRDSSFYEYHHSNFVFIYVQMQLLETFLSDFTFEHRLASSDDGYVNNYHICCKKHPVSS